MFKSYVMCSLIWVFHLISLRFSILVYVYSINSAQYVTIEVVVFFSSTFDFSNIILITLHIENV